MQRFKIDRMLFFMSLGGLFWIPEIGDDLSYCGPDREEKSGGFGK